MSKGAAPEGVGEIAYGPSFSSVEWRIRDYFSISQKVGCGVDGPPFNFSDAVWYLRLYPIGKNANEFTEWISLFLMKKHPESSKHQMQYGFAIVRRDGCKVRGVRGNHLFEEANVGCGWPRYLEVSELNQKRDELLPGGVLTIFCTISANAREGVNAGVQTPRHTGIEMLVHDFKDLLLSGEATDVTLKVQNRDYKVHKAVLVARSTVFSAMMKHDWKEKSNGVVQIDDCDPETFHQFLTYLYSGDLGNFSTDTVFALHNIADKYDAQELKTSCVEFMTHNVSVETFCDVLTLSLIHNESELLEKAVQFFAKNLMDILVTAKWVSFVLKNPLESNEIHIKAAKYNAAQNACSAKEYKCADGRID